MYPINFGLRDFFNSYHIFERCELIIDKCFVIWHAI